MVPGGVVFAELARTLTPYLGDIVFIGGWVHALYILEADGDAASIVRTDDIDITLPRNLDASSRPPLICLVRDAGFEVHRIDAASGLLEISKGAVDLDLLTEAPASGDPVAILGQPDLSVQGYPYQDLLRQNTRSMLVGPELDPSQEHGIEIRVPTLSAYALGKVLSSSARERETKQAKDLVYLEQLLARPGLREELAGALPALITEYAEESGFAAEYLRSVLENGGLLREVARQVIEASGYEMQDDTPVRQQIIARLRRFVGDTWGDGE